MKIGIVAFGCGVLFALGLGISGMTHPSTVLAFLSVTGHWDPRLAFVMVGAIGTSILPFRSILSRPAPRLAPRFYLPSQTRVDTRLIAGSLLFGIGWGLSGYCPGPALVSAFVGAPGALAFTMAMLAGMALFRVMDARGSRTSDDPTQGTVTASPTAG
jgi:uncharacterized protein